MMRKIYLYLMIDLPIEIWKNIIQYLHDNPEILPYRHDNSIFLNPYYILNLYFTCKFFKFLKNLKYDFYFYKNINYDIFNVVGIKSFQHNFYFKNLDFNNLERIEINEGNISFKQLSKLKKLRSLIITQSLDEKKIKIIQKLKQLECLDLSFSTRGYIEDNQFNLKINLSNFTNLKKLNFKDSCIILDDFNFFSKLINLETLILHEIKNDHNNIESLSGLINLSFLSIYLFMLNADKFMDIIKYLKKLNKLNLMNTYNKFTNVEIIENFCKVNNIIFSKEYIH